MSTVRRHVRQWYVRWVRPRIASELDQQRIKLLYDVWGYLPMLALTTLPLRKRLSVLARFLRIDWNVLHGHKPTEITTVTSALASRRSRPGELVVEAGCWNGGSSAKLSIMCAELGYHLHVYDSFEGVEQMVQSEIAESHDFSGEYAASELTVRHNIAEYGVIDVCTFYKGWFADTLAKRGVEGTVRIAYIDCDVATGTREALTGIVPSLADDGEIFSQDFHIQPVRKLLNDPETWTRFRRGQPMIWSRSQLARISFK